MCTNLVSSSENFTTLVELLRYRAMKHPERRAFTFLINGEIEGANLTYGELDRQARKIGAILQRMNVAGECALLLYPPSLEFIAAFFGCLYAGVIAVPAYPPRLNRNMLRLQAIADDAKPLVTLTTSQILSRVAAQLSQAPELQQMQWLATDDITGDQESLWHEPVLTGDTTAFLQYTSGSTANPKGVMVSHDNLLHNEEMIKNAFQSKEHSVIVSWLPLYHDMGLIGNIIHSFYLGASCIVMSPVDFLQKPFRWLQAISCYKATFSGGPNFAYDLCVRKITPEQKATLDLSSWTIAFNGSEPVRHDTLERFTAGFASCGFRKEALYPCYGLAEATLFVTGGLKEKEPVYLSVNGDALERNRVIEVSDENEVARILVGCGTTSSDQKIVIVDPESGIQCLPGQVGEIWLKSSSVAQGYWKRPEETAYTFRACLSDMREGPFLRTGDLGFVKKGELYVTGRIKDLIIIRGQNHYPQDIELTVEQSHPAVRPGCCAAFSVEVDDEEKLIVTAEIERGFRPRKSLAGVPDSKGHQSQDLKQIIDSIRVRVAEVYQLQVYAVLLLKTGSIPKTSSGKIQRHACRVGYLNRTLEIWGE